jgi:hypothetical protein
MRSVLAGARVQASCVAVFCVVTWMFRIRLGCKAGQRDRAICPRVGGAAQRQSLQALMSNMQNLVLMMGVMKSQGRRRS